MGDRANVMDNFRERLVVWLSNIRREYRDDDYQEGEPIRLMLDALIDRARESVRQEPPTGVKGGRRNGG